MHFCVSTVRGGVHGAFCWPRKMGTNWFMPAFVKRRFGESGRSEDEGTTVCCFSRKKSRKLWRISAEVMNGMTVARNGEISPARLPNECLRGGYFLSSSSFAL